MFKNITKNVVKASEAIIGQNEANAYCAFPLLFWDLVSGEDIGQSMDKVENNEFQLASHD